MDRFAPLPVSTTETGSTPECIRMALGMERVGRHLKVGGLVDDLIELAYGDMRIAYK